MFKSVAAKVDVGQVKEPERPAMTKQPTLDATSTQVLTSALGSMVTEESATSAADEAARQKKEKTAEDKQAEEVSLIIDDLENIIKGMLTSTTAGKRIAQDAHGFLDVHADRTFPRLAAFIKTEHDYKELTGNMAAARENLVDYITAFIEQSPLIAESYYYSLQHPFFFLLSSIVTSSALRDALAKAGIIDAISECFAKVANADSSVVFLCRWLITLVTYLVTLLCNDHSSGFSYGRALVTNTQFCTNFGIVMARMWPDIRHNSKASFLSSGFNLARTASRAGCENEFVDRSAFPDVAIKAHLADPHDLALAFKLAEGLGAGKVVGTKLMTELPDLPKEVVDALMAGKAEEHENVHPSSIWNGSNSIEGATAFLPHAKSLLEVFKKAEKNTQDYYAAYGALGNICRYTTHEQRNTLRELSIVDTFSPLMHSKDPDDRPTQAACIVANLIGHIESHPLLKANQDVISLLNTSLLKAWNDEAFEGGSSEPWEPLQALARFAASDDNKPIICSTCVETIIMILDSPRTTSELTEEYAILTLSTLAQKPFFSGDDEARVIDVFRKYKTEGKTEPIQRQAALGLFSLESISDRGGDLLNADDIAEASPRTRALVQEALEDNATNSSPVTRPIAGKKAKRGFFGRKRSKKAMGEEDADDVAPNAVAMGMSALSNAANHGHIMISYPWKHQEVMLKIANSLKQKGFQIWMDVEKMSGSILGAMAEAVEQASVVLVCISEAYKLSNACRTEANYAYQCAKPLVFVRVEDYKPSGWLGALCGTHLYVDFLDTESITDDMGTPMKMLEKQLTQHVTPSSDSLTANNGPVIRHDATNTSATTGSTSTNTSASAAKKVKKLANEVSYWKERAERAEQTAESMKVSANSADVIRREMTKMRLEMSTLTESLMKEVRAATGASGKKSDASAPAALDVQALKEEVGAMKSDIASLKDDVQAMHKAMLANNSEVVALISKLTAAPSSSTVPAVATKTDGEDEKR